MASFTCNQCGEEYASFGDESGPDPSPLTNGHCPKAATRDARAAGLKPSWDPDMPENEILSGIQTAGFARYLETNYHRGAGYRGRRSSEWWYPIWAIQAVKDAMDVGDDPVAACQAYYQVVREMTPEQVQGSMLSDERLLDKE